ncbi:ion channel DMI1-like isoform X1 [Prosopis cineraria]|uniref:ion channel DMI1-like isoform X1 n=1 Tax=Prosopis cineraria TaxID=364024 RepID=UPI00240EC258|nr:ion channel DMI1-like isoform X1 [Prosopis cineraria]XP_054792066.1 ion channel DMI1-like isoform X1 [Prosopis cineraria]XP_054792067.1 ion channel DMI1-like isoform X1 [Prosopis cineraria]
MPAGNEDSSVSLNNNKLERPPLKRPKTLSIPSSTSTSTTNRRFDLGVSIENGSPASGNGDFPNEQWKYPSFLGTTRRKRTTVKPDKVQKLEFSNSMGPKMVGNLKKAGNSSVVPAPPASSSSYSTSSTFSSSASTSIVTLPAHSSSRRPQQNNHSSILYLLIFTCIIFVPYSAYLQYRLAELEGEKIILCCENDICHKDGRGSLEEDDVSFYNIYNTDSRKVALYIVVATLILPFLLYKYLDYLPRIINFFMRNKNNKEDVPLKKKIAYMVDVFFSIYPYAKLLALLFATLFLIGFGGLALYAVTGGSFAEALWHSWTYVADSGNHAETEGTGQRIVSVSISSGGMLIFAMMLGLVSDAISEKVDSLRKGKSEVIEMNHVLILGWSDKLGSLLKQLAIANKSVGGGVIVVLAEKEKEEMELDIAKLEFDFMGTSVICRSGSPLIVADLKKVSVSKARAIIVLASDENADQSDARALRVVLSLTGVKEGLTGHVVVEMSDLDNEPLVKLVGGELIETVVAHDVIGRLMIQCALQPGLAQIWEDILGFENAEFYIKRWPELDGLCFKDVLISFADAIPCGIKVAAERGKIIINPDDSYIMRQGDEVLVIAEDDDTYAPGPLPEVRKGHFLRIPDPPKYPEKILFCGWRRDIDDMIMVLEALLAPGSELWMFNEVPEKERERKLADGGLAVSGLLNVKLVHREGNAVIRRHLESLPLETFDSILILADESVEDSVAHSDSRSLATLLLIRDIQSRRLPYKDSKSSTSLRLSGFSHSSWIREMQQASDKSIIISEILDSRTRNLVSVSRISDYVLSNELVSMALAMVAEDKQINRVLEELFAEEGNEMCIKPAEFYLFDQEELCFYDIMNRARERGEIVIGYRLANQDRAIINPPEKSVPRKWSLDDVFVVIASGD